MGDPCNGSDVFGDIFAHRTVTACGTERQPSVLIGQGHGQTVDFRLHGVHDFRRVNAVFRQGIGGPGQKCLQLLLGEHIGQASHFHGMSDLFKLLRCRAADSVSGRIGHINLRERRFQLFQLFKHGVILEVGDLGGILIIIQLRCVPDFSPKLLRPQFRLFCRKIIVHLLHRLFDLSFILPHTAVFFKKNPRFIQRLHKKTRYRRLIR